MKIKKTSLRREQQVYYFEHRHGVLKNKTRSRYNLITGFAMTAVVIGAAGLGVHGLINQQAKMAATNYQRESDSVSAGSSTQSEESADTLKSAVTKAREDDQLARQIKSKLKSVPGGQKWSVYVRDLNSDRMASINADQLNDAPGLGSLFMVAPLEAKLPSANWTYRAGKSTIGKCVETMISSNDAACTQAVGQYADLKNADSINAGLGFKKTNIDAKKQETTARELGDLLYRLQNGQVLSDKGRRTVFDGMYANTNRDGIVSGCDQKCLVAHVSGEDKNVRSEAAIVSTGRSKYVVVFMTEGGSWSQIADVSAAVRLIMEP